MKKIVPIFLSLFLILVIVPEKVWAQSSIKVTTEPGFNKSVKMWRSYPLHITIENSGDEAFSGDLVIYFSGSYRSMGARVVPVHVESGAKEKYTVTMPASSDMGYYFDYNEEQIVLYKGSWRSGHKVQFTGDKQVYISYVDPGTVTVGMLSEHPDRLAKFKGAPGSQKVWHSFQAEDIPEEGEALSYFDYIIIDEFPLATLSQEAQEAILDWVKAGGTLVVGATSNPLQTYGILFDELPLKAKEEQVLQHVEVGEDVEFATLPIYTGPVEDGKVKLYSDEIPLILEKDFGSGKIVQTVFSLGDEPVISTEGYPKWFNTFLQSKSRHGGYISDMIDTLYWDYARYNEYFDGPDLSTVQLAGIFAIYLTVIVPLLYIILKRKDKREHAWWLIPSVSLLCSVMIFVYGAKDRISQAQMNEMGLYINENSRLEGIHAVALQSNKGGDYTVRTKRDEYTPIPLTSDDVYMENKNKVAHLEMDRNEIDIIYPNMEYWAVRSIVGEASPDIEGSFSYDLTFADDTLKGTITNQYPIAFEEVFIWSGDKQISLGSVASGETIAVDVSMKNSFLRAPFASGALPDETKDLNWEEMTQETLLNSSINHLLFVHTKPVIAGITKEKIISAELVDEKVKHRRISLIVQPFRPEFERNGEFTIENEEFSVEVIPVTGGYYEFESYPTGGMQILADPGTYEFIFSLPTVDDLEQLKVSEIAITIGGVDAYTILNTETEEFDALDREQGRRFVFSEEVEKYMSENGEIKIQVEKTSFENPYIYIPQIRLKGSVTGND